MKIHDYLQKTLTITKYGSLGILALLGLWLGGTAIGIHTASKPYKEHWETLKRQHQHPPNSSAEKIAELIDQMGFSEDYDLTNQLASYIRKQWRLDPYSTLKTIPSSLAAYLQLHEKTIEDIKNTLLSQGTPRGAIDLEDIFSLDQTFRMAQLDLVQLHQILLLSAWQADRYSDNNLAQEYIKAAELLVQSVWEKPFLINQAGAFTITENHLAFIRYSSHPYEWNLFSSSEAMMQVVLGHFNEELSWGIHTGLSCGSDCYDTVPNFFWKMPLRVMAQPYFDWMLLDTTRVFKQRLSKLLQKPDVCSWVMAEFQAQDQKQKLLWNRNPLLTGEDNTFYSYLSRAARLQLEVELTQKVHDLKKIKIEQGQWPKTISGIEISSVCPNQRWIYTVLPDNTMIFRLADDIPISDASEVALIYGALPENSQLDFDVIFIRGPIRSTEKDLLDKYEEALKALVTVGVESLKEAEAILEASKPKSIRQVSSLAEAERIQKQLQSVDIKVTISKVIPASFLEPS